MYRKRNGYEFVCLVYRKLKYIDSKNSEAHIFYTKQEIDTMTNYFKIGLESVG